LSVAQAFKIIEQEIKMSITFNEIKQYVSRVVRVSICFEDGSYDNYTLISDIPEGKYNKLYLFGVGMIDVEFPRDVYSKPDAKQSDKLPGYFWGCGLELVLHGEPRNDIARNNEKQLTFGDLKNYLQIGRNFSIVLSEDWSSEEYEWRKEIPDKYDELFVYGIGIEDNTREDDPYRSENPDSYNNKQMVIVLSKTPRRL
jgi:hypothetical protein